VRESREEAITRFLRGDRDVRVIASPPAFHDMNDWLRSLVGRYGYRPDFTGHAMPLTWSEVLREAVPIRPGDPAAIFCQRVTDGAWDPARATTLRAHPALRTIECPDSRLPALVAPVLGPGGVAIGAMVAWLAPSGAVLAPLLLPVRLLGSRDGVVTIAAATTRGASEHAHVAIGFENALALAALGGTARDDAVFCVIDPSHAVRCAPGVPREVLDVTMWTENEDVTLAGELFVEEARRRLEKYELRVRSRRPWDEFRTMAKMVRAFRGEIAA
jgi:hypothetical protein